MEGPRVEAIQALVEPILAERDMELVELTCRSQGRQWLVRLLVDRVGGVTIQQCAQVNQLIGQALETAGVIEGSYSVRRNAPDAGVAYDLRGSAMLDAFGTFDMDGSVQTTGFIQSGRATGVVVLTNAKGSITLALTGPVQPGFAPPPTSMTYTIQGATGAYAGMTGRGSTNVSFTSGTTFRMTMQAMCN